MYTEFRIRRIRLGALALVALAVSATPVRAQAPLLTGTIEIGLTAGTLRADVCLADLPVHGDTVRFLLHRGLNLKGLRDEDGAVLSHSTRRELDGVAVAYDAVGVVGSRELCLEYVGAFPVYAVEAGDYRASDGSSVIAFNGLTVRARGETRWYPTPTDPASGRTFEALRYRLRVECDDCDHVYLNGADPAAGPSAMLQSDEARELLLFAGDYPFTTVDGVHFLGESVAPDIARRFVALMAEVQDFYAGWLGVDYGEPIDVLRIVPVRFDRPGQFWGFFSDPALGLVGLSIAQFVEILGEPDHPARAPVLGALTHELAHRFFAGGLAAESESFQLFSEPFATYLDLEATRHFHGEEAYVRRVHALAARALEGPPLTPLDRAGPDELAQDRYRYGYAPLVLLALERRVGALRMRALLRELVTAPAARRARADYGFLRAAAGLAGVGAAEWRRWEVECVAPPIGENHCLQDFRRPAGESDHGHLP
jgi:hypothetical protein